MARSRHARAHRSPERASLLRPGASSPCGEQSSLAPAVDAARRLVAIVPLVERSSGLGAGRGACAVPRLAARVVRVVGSGAGPTQRSSSRPAVLLASPARPARGVAPSVWLLPTGRARFEPARPCLPPSPSALGFPHHPRPSAPVLPSFGLARPVTSSPLLACPARYHAAALPRKRSRQQRVRPPLRRTPELVAGAATGALARLSV